jgi:HipA-like C-terminal domain
VLYDSDPWLAPSACAVEGVIDLWASLRSERKGQLLHSRRVIPGRVAMIFLHGRRKLYSATLTCAMFQIVDVSEWELDTTVTATGRRAKEWLIEPRGRRYALFKLPRYHSAESTAEKLASELGRLFGIPTAHVDLALRNGEYGVISYKFLEPGESLAEGGDLIVIRDPQFDRFDTRVHSFQLVEGVLAPIAPRLVSSLIEMLVFDAAIGNSDRHQDNWGVILSSKGEPRLAPAYDHGSSLGSHIDEDKIEMFLEPARLDVYARRGQSRVGWLEGGGTRRLRHLDLLQCIAEEYPTEVTGALSKIFGADLSLLSTIFEGVPDAYAGERRRLLVDRLVRRRIGLLKEAFRDANA